MRLNVLVTHTCSDYWQHFFWRFSIFLWCRQLLLKILQFLLVLQQVAWLQVINVQRQVFAQHLNLKLQVQL